MKIPLACLLFNPIHSGRNPETCSLFISIYWQHLRQPCGGRGGEGGEIPNISQAFIFAVELKNREIREN